MAFENEGYDMTEFSGSDSNSENEDDPDKRASYQYIREKEESEGWDAFRYRTSTAFR